MASGSRRRLETALRFPECPLARATALSGSGAGLADARREAEAAFRRAGEAAARHKALALELRAALSLAHLQRSEGRSAEARSALAPVVARFAEGHATGDLVAARALLAELR